MAIDQHQVRDVELTGADVQGWSSVSKDMFAPRQQAEQTTLEKAMGALSQPFENMSQAAKEMVHGSLAKVQDMIEKAAEKIHDKSAEKDPLKCGDSQKKQQCPFKKIADAVGYKYDKSSGNDSAEDAEAKNAKKA